MIKKFLIILFILIGIFVGFVIISVFVLPAGYNMYYSEYENSREYNVKGVVFSSGIRDYQNIAFEANREGFRGGCFWLNASMDNRFDVTVNSYDIYFVYKNKTVLISQSEINRKMSFMESEYAAMCYESASTDICKIFYIPDSELKKIKGVKIIANVTVSDDTESVTENMEFEYKTEYKGYSAFEGIISGI